MIKNMVLFCVCCLVGCIHNEDNGQMDAVIQLRKDILKLNTTGSQYLPLRDLVTKLGQPDRVLKAEDVYGLLIEKYGGDSPSNLNLAQQIMMHQYSFCSNYLSIHEPVYDDWKKSNKFKEMDFYFYDSRGGMQRMSCTHFKSQATELSIYFIVDDNIVIRSGELPQI